MNFKKSALASAITLATFATGAAAFDASSWEVSGFVKNETAALQKDGTFHGQYNLSTDTGDKNSSGDLIKSETTAKVFVNGDLTENTALHAELNFVYDPEATPSDYEGHDEYTQNDYLRELYVDTLVGPVEFRLGKQQVVWGTADGMKLLDIINPTDYREFAQNTMEDSRIPVWMVKMDAPLGDTASLQALVSQAERNKIAGMTLDNGATRTWQSGNANLVGADAGHPMIMKGVDTISGRVNGFFNIGAAMGAVTNTFYQGGFTNPAATASPFYTEASYAAANGVNMDFDQDGVVNDANAATGAIAPPEITTVSNFADGFTANAVAALGLDATCGAGADGADCLSAFTEATNGYVTNLFDNTGGDYDSSNPNSMWEYMPNATFATFNAFVGMNTKYRRVKTDDLFDSNVGLRYKNSLDNGLNFSLNYLYAYDPNPVVQVHWEGSNGERLETVEVDGPYSTKVLQLKNGSTYYGANADYTGTYTTATNVTNANNGGAATLVFEESLQRVQNLGTSFDYTIDSGSLPVVLRGEFLYQKDVKTPVINRTALGYGNLTEALKMENADFFKYVIGADVTVLTNMLVSGQFIQNRNLDYVDQGASLSDTTWKYTADPAAMHLSNGLKKAEENKEFYSLFLSKPFGPNQLGRWNNIFIFEEGGGKWNRFDVEYSFSDELVGSFELNNYWGDANTQFGQMEDSSNIQVGLKYLF
jgi:hypothetical protein